MQVNCKYKSLSEQIGEKGRRGTYRRAIIIGTRLIELNITAFEVHVACTSAYGTDFCPRNRISHTNTNTGRAQYIRLYEDDTVKNVPAAKSWSD